MCGHWNHVVTEIPHKGIEHADLNQVNMNSETMHESVKIHGPASKIVK